MAAIAHGAFVALAVAVSSPPQDDGSRSGER